MLMVLLTVTNSILFDILITFNNTHYTLNSSTFCVIFTRERIYTFALHFYLIHILPTRSKQLLSTSIDVETVHRGLIQKIQNIIIGRISQKVNTEPSQICFFVHMICIYCIIKSSSVIVDCTRVHSIALGSKKATILVTFTQSNKKCLPLSLEMYLRSRFI